MVRPSELDSSQDEQTMPATNRAKQVSRAAANQFPMRATLIKTCPEARFRKTLNFPAGSRISIFDGLM
jgi:hypothetical protein